MFMSNWILFVKYTLLTHIIRVFDYYKHDKAIKTKNKIKVVI